MYTRLFFQVIEFYYRLIHNANFDIEEKPIEIKAASLLEEKPMVLNKPVVLDKPMVLDKGNNDEVFNALPIEDYDKDYEGSGL